MEVTLQNIIEHPHYYKWCRKCNCFNHVDNEECHHCGADDFKYDITTDIEEEKNFQAWSNGLEPKEAYITVK